MVGGVSRLVAITAVVVVLVAIASFFGGMQAGRSVAPQAVTQILTVTAPQRVTVTQTILQTITASTPLSPTQTPTQPTPTSAAKLPDKIVIGMSIPLSGTHAETGKRGLLGVLAAIKWVNEVYGGVHLYGKAIPLELKYYDDESKKENVIAFTERLITVDKVHFLLSTHSSPLVFAQAPVAEKYKMLLVNWGGATDAVVEQGYKYIVQVLTPASMYLLTALYALKDIDPMATKIAILYRDDELNRFASEALAKKALELGYKIVYKKSYPTTINDFTSYIAELAKSGADALFVGAYTVDGLLLSKQLADANVNFKYIAMNQAPCIQDYYDSLKTLAEGILCPSQWEPAANYNPDLAGKMGVEWFGPTKEEFLRYFESVGGSLKLLSYHAAMAAAGVLVLVKAIEVAQSLDPTAVREAFNKLYLMTFFGLFKIDPATGKQVAHEMVLGQWQGGKFVVVWPPGIAEAKLYYPIPTWDEKRAGKTIK